jgi:glycosyltransferase involved in cell wall biosynthesis
MKIAYLINRYPSISHTFIRREIAGLERHGVEVIRYSIRADDGEGGLDAADRAEQERTVVLLNRGPLALLPVAAVTALARPVRFLRALGAVRRLGARSPKGRLYHLAYLAEACALRRDLARRDVDHLHAHFGTNPAAVALLCRILGGPAYSLTIHGPEEFDCPAALSIPEKVRRAAFAVAVSDYGRAQLMRWVPSDQWDKLHVVRCGVDDAFLGAAPTPPPAGRRFVCVGRLCADKGHLLLVQAAAKLRQEGLDFDVVLAGDGPMRPAIEKAIVEGGLADRISLRGWLDGPGVRREILNGRCLVQPSLAEGLPVTLMEALALGRPAIASAVAGIPELVRPGETGWLVPPGSVEPLADAMRECLHAPEDRLRALGEAGRHLAIQRHQAIREAARLAALVGEACRPPEAVHASPPAATRRGTRRDGDA